MIQPIKQQCSWDTYGNIIIKHQISYNSIQPLTVVNGIITPIAKVICNNNNNNNNNSNNNNDNNKTDNNNNDDDANNMYVYIYIMK